MQSGVILEGFRRAMQAGKKWAYGDDGLPAGKSYAKDMECAGWFERATEIATWLAGVHVTRIVLLS